MARIFHPKIVTANALLEGDVIYLKSDMSWSRHHGEAHLLHSQAEAEAMLEQAERHGDRIVGAYLADARIGDNGQVVPVHFREAFRTRGPSNYPEHGKQAES